MFKKGKDIWNRYQEIKRQYKDSIVLSQLGSFVEVMGEDATAIAEIFDVNVGKRIISHDFDTGETVSVPLVGLPCTSSTTFNTYKEMLKARGYSIVLVLYLGCSKHENVFVFGPYDSTESCASYPIGRIEFLDKEGKIRNAAEYMSVYSLKADLREEIYFGSRMTVVLYEGPECEELIADIAKLGSSLHRLDVIPNPYKKVGDDVCSGSV